MGLAGRRQRGRLGEVNSTQYHFFNALIESAHESRLHLHEVAWVLLGVLLFAAILIMSVFWLWVLQGGFEKYYGLNSVHSRRTIQEWLQET